MRVLSVTWLIPPMATWAISSFSITSFLVEPHQTRYQVLWTQLLCSGTRCSRSLQLSVFVHIFAHETTYVFTCVLSVQFVKLLPPPPFARLWEVVPSSYFVLIDWAWRANFSYSSLCYARHQFPSPNSPYSACTAPYTYVSIDILLWTLAAGLSSRLLRIPPEIRASFSFSPRISRLYLFPILAGTPEDCPTHSLLCLPFKVLNLLSH